MKTIGWIARTPLLVLAIALLSACGPRPGTAPAAAPPPEPAGSIPPEWDQLMADARREGKLIVGMGGSDVRFLGDFYRHFSEKFGIEVIPTTGSGPTQVDRILAERARGIYDMDVTMFGGTASNRLVEAGVSVPIKSTFILPDLLDRSQNWVVNRDIWVDSARQYTTAFSLRLERNLADVHYNTNKVSRAEIDAVQSYSDFLKPEWRGRIGTYLEPSFMGPTTPRTWMWTKLGSDWFARFTREQRVFFLGDDFREHVDGLIRGAWDVLLMVDNPLREDVRAAAQSGLPVATLDRTLREGRIAVGSGSGLVMDKAPHPRAAQLFINWLHSRDGQTALLELTADPDPDPSLRTDVPQGKVVAEKWQLRTAFNPEELLDITDPQYLQSIEQAIAWLKQMSAEQRVYGY